MILIAPVKTEKSIGKIEIENSLRFEVAFKATKKQIKDEVEKLFSVKVHSVKTLVTPEGRKHAVVRLAKEYKADDIATKLKMVA
jgi:ribosomal protein L23